MQPILGFALFGFIFASPLATVAIALGAASIPVIIHLINRRRYRIVQWAAMRFLLAAEKQSVKRMRLEQLILLIVRTVMILLLVLGMASVTPWAEAALAYLFPESSVLTTGRGLRTHKIIVLDGSMSMALKAGDKSCFDQARSRAIQVLENSGSGDGFSVILMGTPAQRIVPEPSDDSGRVATEIQALRVPHGNADVPGALLAIEDMLKQSPAKYEAREVYFFTDLQKATLGDPGVNEAQAVLARIGERASVIFVDVGVDGIANVAVTSLKLDSDLVTTGTEITVKATLRRFGGDDKKSVIVELLVGRAKELASDPPFELRVLQQKDVPVAPGAAGEVVSFTFKLATAGEYAIQVRTTADAMEPDDARTLIVTAKDSVPVVLVNGKPAVKPQEKGTGFLEDALNPFETGPAPRNVAPRCKVLTESQFSDAALGDLSATDCVFLCDVARLSPAEVRRLENHVQKGGGVVFCMGPHVDIEAYNRLIYRDGAGILPAKLVGIQKALSDRTFQLHATDENIRLPPLQVFAGEYRSSLFSPRFREYIRTELAPRTKARTILSFMPEPLDPKRAEAPSDPERTPLPADDPAVIIMPVQQGRVALLTTTANADWTSWPIAPSYMPFIQELFKYMVAGRLHERSATVGDTIEEFMPASNAGLPFTVQTPDGRTETGTIRQQEESAVLRFSDTSQSGIYRIKVGDNPRERLFAVNVPVTTASQRGTESDPARLDHAELETQFPGIDLQIVTDPKDVVGRTGVASAGSPGRMGAFIARLLLYLFFALLLAETLLAQRLAHHSQTISATPPAAGWLLPSALGFVALTLFVGTAFCLGHAWWTGDFLGFLPEWLRSNAEAALGVPKPVPGESTRWRLEFSSFLPGPANYQLWLVGAIILCSVALVVGTYRREGRNAGPGYRMLLSGLRLFLILLTIVVLLPQARVWFERQGWPDVVLLIDTSESMSATDHYEDSKVRAAAEKLIAQLPPDFPSNGVDSTQRLQLVQALLAGQKSNWIEELAARHQFKVHVYRCASRAERLANVTEPDEKDAAVTAIRQLKPDGQSSQLGGAVRQVLNDFRGSSLTAIIMLTDGVITEGEDLVQASQHAAKAGVPLYLVGMGDSHEPKDLILHDLRAEDAVFVNDRVVFEARVTSRGYKNARTVQVTLYEKKADGTRKSVATERITTDPQGKPVKVRLVHQPTEAGEKVYVMEVAEQSDEVQKDNNRLEHTVLVRPAKPVRILYIDGFPRPEYRYLKTLLERESADDQKNKSLELQVLLLEAQEQFATQDKSARADFPTREELNNLDVVILGDVNPRHAKLGERNLGLLVDFVRERGGGLLFQPGEHFGLKVWKDSCLASVLPIEVDPSPPTPLPQGERERTEGFRPEPTPVGLLHPILRLNPDETENRAIWKKLAPLYWYADGYKLAPAAEVLAVNPRAKFAHARPGIGPEHQPIIAQHFVGAGRCIFLGSDETWRWAFREDVIRFNQFWIQTVKYLARTGLGRIELRVDRQTPYRRGEPIRTTLRFPDDTPPPADAGPIKVTIERRPLRNSPGAGQAPDVTTLKLAKLEGSRGTYETVLTQTPEGEYSIWLSAPLVPNQKPRTECRVLPPPGEMEQLLMNRADLERAAEQSHGRFYTLADADQLPNDLPTGSRLVMKTPGPPWLLWNHLTLFLLVVGLFTTEWVLRKRKHLL